MATDYRCMSLHPKYKLGIEVHEYNHEGTNFENELSRQLMIESHGITIIRTNPDAAGFDMNRPNKPNIHAHY